MQDTAYIIVYILFERCRLVHIYVYNILYVYAVTVSC